MEHLTDKDILDALSQGALESGIVGEHLRRCEACRGRVEEFRRTWDVLGEWTMETPEVDLTGRILARAKAGRTIYLWQPKALLRVAASIIVGIGVGSLSGLPVRGEVSKEQVSEAMYLDVLAVDSSTGWAEPMLVGDVEN